MKKQLLFAVLTLALSACGEARTELFNGRDLSGWVCFVDPGSGIQAGEVFGVQDGNIRIAGTPLGYMRTAEPYGNYTLHVEWRWIGEPSNSGIFQRVQEGDRLWPDAIECQLMAGHAGDFVMLGGSKIAEVESVEAFPIKQRNNLSDCEKASGEWNQAEVVCKGDQITVRVNGVLQNACTKSKDKGYIALQSEGGPVEFRNVYITEAE